MLMIPVFYVSMFLMFMFTFSVLIKSKYNQQAKNFMFCERTYHNDVVMNYLLLSIFWPFVSILILCHVTIFVFDNGSKITDKLAKLVDKYL